MENPRKVDIMALLGKPEVGNSRHAAGCPPARSCASWMVCVGRSAQVRHEKDSQKEFDCRAPMQPRVFN